MNKGTQEFLKYFVEPPLVVDGDVGRRTRAAMLLAIAKIKEKTKKHNLEYNDRFMFVGIRTNRKVSNLFDDWFLLIQENNVIAIKASTKIGYPAVNKYLRKVVNGRRGFGIVAPNQQIEYELIHPEKNKTWLRGWTGGKGYLYHSKHILVKIIRDANGDYYLDYNKPYNSKGEGFNVHTWKGHISKFVGYLSEGCQVCPETYWDFIFNLLYFHSFRNQRGVLSQFYTILEW